MNEFDEAEPLTKIVEEATTASDALKRLAEVLGRLQELGGRIDRGEYATLAQLEHQWATTSHKIVEACFEAWKKNQPGEEDMPNDATT